MDYTLHIPEALELVSAWEVPPEEFAQAVNSQAKLMAGLGLEPSTEIPADNPYSALRF
jgi:hypothetical protein